METNKVIFLDVDGVLNDAATSSQSPGGFTGISAHMLGNLKQIVDATSAKIVLVSTWKAEWSADPGKRTADGAYLHDTLASVGLTIADKTEDRVKDRGEGIVNWLANHPEITSWIVLDDEIFGDYMQFGIMPHLIKTRYMYGGLTTDNAKQAIYMLNHDREGNSWN